jgi:hypothetical protein
MGLSTATGVPKKSGLFNKNTVFLEVYRPKKFQLGTGNGSKCGLWS